MLRLWPKTVGCPEDVGDKPGSGLDKTRRSAQLDPKREDVVVVSTNAPSSVILLSQF